MGVSAGQGAEAALPAALEIVEPLCAVFRRKLKREGLKYTPERARVLDAIIRMEDMFEPEQVVEIVRDGEPRVSKATVYRTLKLLTEAGVIQRVLFDGAPEQAQYQLAYGRSASEMVIRLDTRQVIPVSVPGLDDMCARVCRGLGLTHQGHRLQIIATGRAKASE